MKLMDKLKNMFTEEVDVVEEPIKKDIIKIEIPAPESKKTVENIKPDNQDTASKDEKFVFPVYFDDKDFNDIKKTVAPVEPKKEVKTYGGVKSGATISEPKKIFKPTPIISPVYGILDKNYHKEDIVHKPTSVSYKETTGFSIDDIRKKAYGTLEDELETTLTNKTFSFNRETTIATGDDIDMFDELEQRIKKSREKEEYSSSLETTTDFDILDECNNMVEEELNKEISDDDKMSESDLFNLIDSMYEKGDEDGN